MTIFFELSRAAVIAIAGGVRRRPQLGGLRNSTIEP
jgi:hypothetical protein